MTVTRVAWGRLDNLSTAVLRELVENRREELVCSGLACEGEIDDGLLRWQGVERVEDTRGARRM